MGRQKIPRSAKWGAACAPCVVAKTRCVRSKPDGAKCDRCQSLEKYCTDQVHKPRKRRYTKTLRTSNPEERPRSFSDLLEPSGQVRDLSRIDSSRISNKCDVASNRPSSSGHTQPEAQNMPSRQTSRNITRSEVSSNVSAFTTCTCRVILNKEDIVPMEPDDILLSIFMNQLSTRFPFVVVPTGTTPGQLQSTRPLLLEAIRMVASVRNLESMREQYRAVVQHISDAMIMRSERSMDLLQSILVVLGFYHYHCDMGLATSPTPLEGGDWHLPIHAETVSRTNEERRALAGVWYMSSNSALVSTQFQPLRHTKYLRQCLEELDTAAEYETDRLAIQLVRVQYITEKIVTSYTIDRELRSIPQASARTRLEEFQMELDELRDTVPSDLRLNYVLSCHYNSAYLRLFDSFLAGAHCLDHEPQSFASLSLSHPDQPILDIFSRFTAALATWFEDWLSVPVCAYFYLPQPISAQLIHASMMLSRWVRVAGSSVVMLSHSGNATSLKELPILRQPLMAFSGVPECPDLGQPQPSLVAVPMVSANILGQLRALVLSQPSLRVDVFGILDSMARRFKATKIEMAAAQGAPWKNNTWDIAADHIELKKARILKWCGTITVALEDDRSHIGSIYHPIPEGNVGGMDTVDSPGIGGIDWPLPSNNRESGQWEMDLFDKLMGDIHGADIIDTFNDWGIMDYTELTVKQHLDKEV